MIRTERLLLRQWRDEDRAPFAAQSADPVVMEHFPALLTREQSDAMVDRIGAHFAEHGYGLWAVEVDGEFAGFTGIAWSHGLPFPDAPEVGWRLARRFWGHGYASEAATAAVQHLFEREERVISVTALTNVRSEAVMQRIGLAREGEFDHPRVPEGSPLRRHVLYAATRQTWSPHSVF